MRTTLNIDDDLLREAKIAAIRRHATLTSLIESALRKELTVEATQPRRAAQGLPAHVDPYDARAVWQFQKHAGEDWTMLRALGPFPSKRGEPRREFDWADSSALLEELEPPVAHP